MIKRTLIITISCIILAINFFAIMGSWGFYYIRKTQFPLYNWQYEELQIGKETFPHQTKEELLMALINLTKGDSKNYYTQMNLVIASTFFNIILMYIISKNRKSR